MRKAATAKTAIFSAGSSRRTAGYTLLELLVVMVLMVGILSIVPPMFERGTSATELRSISRQMMASMRHARSEAVSRRKPVSFILELDERRYRIEGKTPVKLPDELELELVTADSERRGEGAGAITFFSDGSASGGNLTLIADASRLRLDVDWISGRVSIHE